MTGRAYKDATATDIGFFYLLCHSILFINFLLLGSKDDFNKYNKTCFSDKLPTLPLSNQSTIFSSLALVALMAAAN